MNNQQPVNWRLIIATLLCAFAASIFPLPTFLDWYRPEWLILVLIFWAVHVPERVGLGSAWCLGLLQDGVRGAVLGQHALALTVVAYLSIQMKKRFRLFPLWQQSVVVLLMIITVQTTSLLISGVIGHEAHSWRYWLSSFTSACCWPFIAVVMSRLLERYPAMRAC